MLRRLLRNVKCGRAKRKCTPPPCVEDERSRDRPVDDNVAQVEPLLADSERSPSYEYIDLLTTCQDTRRTDEPENSSTDLDLKHASSDERRPIIIMGQKYSSPLTSRNKSKISLTWVLREQDHARKFTPHHPNQGLYYDDCRIQRRNAGASVDRYQRHNQKFDENRCRYEKTKSRSEKRAKARSSRVVGRNALYNEESNNDNNKDNSVKSKRGDKHSEIPSELSGSEKNRSQRKHRHKRRRNHGHGDKELEQFGYQIKDIDYFLCEASIENPGNIPVVVAYPSVLYQTQNGAQKELSLPLGMVVNAVFKNKQWLYVQTPHGEEGYIMYAACLPLGILPTIHRSNSTWHDTPCWESNTDIYPRPCGNMTDSEKEQLRGRARSECGRRIKTNPQHKQQTGSVCGEQTFDKIYLKAASLISLKREVSDEDTEVSSITNRIREINLKNKTPKHKTKHKEINKGNVTRHTLLVVNAAYEGSSVANTLSVNKGDVVILIQGGGIESDVDAEWFYVRRKDGKEGFIPAAVAGHGYI